MENARISNSIIDYVYDMCASLSNKKEIKRKQSVHEFSLLSQHKFMVELLQQHNNHSYA
mgnify:CR=1 FL=1